MRFALAGTPELAAQVLRHLVALGHRPCLIVSQPDKKRGRGRKTCCPEVVGAAQGLEMPCLQVEDINSDEAVETIAASGAKILVVMAFGQLFKPVVLDRFLCLNIHTSLLPAYRGAAPIERAIAAGEKQTGVSIMRMVEGLDEGPWALQRTVSIDRRDDTGSVGRMLALMGAEGVDQVLTGLVDDNVVWTEQSGPSGYAAKLTAADLVFDPCVDADKAHDQVRSLSPALGARAASGPLHLKLWRTWPYGVEGSPPVPACASAVAGVPGHLSAEEGRLFVGCAEGALELLSVQPAGKGKMAAADFLRGYGSRLRQRLDLVDEDR